MPKKRVISAGVIVSRTTSEGDLEVLLQLKRKFQQWEFPGGKLDGSEKTTACACRELLEETGIVVEELEFVTYVDHGKEFCCLMFLARKWSGCPSLSEPDKQPILGWFPLYQLPKPLTKAARASVVKGALRPLYAEAGVDITEVEGEYADKE